MLTEATFNKVSVVAVTDGKQIAWRFSWDDAVAATMTETGIFSDAVGVQFPLVPNAPFTMGGPGMPVHSLYWRAHWQRDIDEGFVDIHTLYPNAYSGVYWFSQGSPARVPASFQDKRSHAWFSGLSAGNPMSIWNRTSPRRGDNGRGIRIDHSCARWHSPRTRCLEQQAVASCHPAQDRRGSTLETLCVGQYEPVCSGRMEWRGRKCWRPQAPFAVG